MNHAWKIGITCLHTVHSTLERPAHAHACAAGRAAWACMVRREREPSLTRHGQPVPQCVAAGYSGLTPWPSTGRGWLRWRGAMDGS